MFLKIKVDVEHEFIDNFQDSAIKKLLYKQLKILKTP
jgi:hypothetical protein